MQRSALKLEKRSSSVADSSNTNKDINDQFDHYIRVKTNVDLPTINLTKPNSPSHGLHNISRLINSTHPLSKEHFRHQNVVPRRDFGVVEVTTAQKY